MAEMGRYCKAYHVRSLREFPGWAPRLENLRPDARVVDGEEVERTRAELHDDDILYVQETYVVTDGIFLDENVVFDAVTPEWEEFCRGVLGFELPPDEAPRPEPAAAGAEG
ncbi:MAG TPA: hypothetical protein VF746_01050 [Longimicrobium sp.]|jgi:hypothetical protein